MKKTVKLVSLMLIVCVIGMILTACTPASVDAAKDKMTKAGYSISDYDYSLYENAIGGLTAYKGTILSGNRVSVSAVLFETEEDATNAANNALVIQWTVDGKWIYSGDAEAIEAFTK